MAPLVQVARQRDRYTKLFGLYTLPSRDGVLETRTPAPLPQEQHGLRVLVKVMDLRWAWLYLWGVATFCKLCRLEAAFEPIFAELALYDLKERKKVCINTSYVHIIIVCYVRTYDVCGRKEILVMHISAN